MFNLEKITGNPLVGLAVAFIAFCAVITFIILIGI